MIIYMKTFTVVTLKIIYQIFIDLYNNNIFTQNSTNAN